MEIERFCDRELEEMKKKCMSTITSFALGKYVASSSSWMDIYNIALVEINRELDVRKSK